MLWKKSASGRSAHIHKAGIVLPSKDKLPTVIDTLIATVKAGELDDLFSQAAKTGSIGKAKKAAA